MKDRIGNDRLSEAILTRKEVWCGKSIAPVMGKKFAQPRCSRLEHDFKETNVSLVQVRHQNCHPKPDSKIIISLQAATLVELLLGRGTLPEAQPTF